MTMFSSYGANSYKGNSAYANAVNAGVQQYHASQNKKKKKPTDAGYYISKDYANSAQGQKVIRAQVSQRALPTNGYSHPNISATPAYKTPVSTYKAPTFWEQLQAGKKQLNFDTLYKSKAPNWQKALLSVPALLGGEIGARVNGDYTNNKGKVSGSKFTGRLMDEARSAYTGGAVIRDNVSGPSATKPMDTGSKFKNGAASLLGMGAGFSVHNPFLNTSLGSGLNKAIGNPTEKYLLKGASRFGLNNSKALTKIGISGAKTGAEFAGLNAMSSAARGDKGKDILKSAGQGFIGGAMFGAGGKSLGLLSKGLKSMPKTSTLRQNIFDNKFGKLDNNTGNQLSIAAPKVKRPLPKGGINDLGTSPYTINSGGSKETYTMPKINNPKGNLKPDSINTSNFKKSKLNSPVQSKIMNEETYLAKNGASNLGIGDAGLHKASKNVSQNMQDKLALNQFNKDGLLINKREALRQDYNSKVAQNEIRPQTKVEKLIETANGNTDNESVQAARRLLTKKNIDWTQKTSPIKDTWGNFQSKIKPIIKSEKVSVDPSQPNWTGPGHTTTEATKINLDPIIPLKGKLNPKNDMTSSNMSEFKMPNEFTKIKPGDNLKPLNEKLNNPVKPTFIKQGDPNWNPSLEHPTTSEFVDNKPLQFNIGKNDKATSQSLRDAFTGKENGQIVAGNHLADTMKSLAPKEQEGIQLFIDSGGDINHLKEMATHNDPIMDSYIPNTKITYRDGYNQALNLSPNAMKAAKMAQKYYTESGDYALKTGSTSTIKENYANRMWVKAEKGVKTDIRNNGINPNTSHGKQRVYDNISEGLLNGKQPATLKANDLLSIHNQEMAHANTTRELATTLETNGLGKYSNDVPVGFKNVAGLDKHIATKDGMLVKNFVLPENLANGLRAITDTDLTKKIDSLRGIQKYQGVVKTVDLAVSTFHHITLTAQALYNNKGGLDFVKHWKDLNLLSSPEFQTSEKDFAQHTGTTSKISSNIDTLNKLTTTGSRMDKITNLPILKQGKQAIEANNNLLFGKIQRWLKVTDYQNKVIDYASKHPNTVNGDLSKAKISIAKEVNLAYGGLNWKSLGKNPSTLGLERMVFLAPDWTESSVRMIGKAFEKSPGGKAARSQYAVGLTGGLLLTEGLNHLMTGHFTDQNPKGHELQVQVQPDVYISLFRSGIGDATKLVSNVVTNGVLGGVSKTLQGKFSPFLRTGIGLASNTDYLGRKISDPKKTGMENNLNIAKYIGSGAGPIPFGVPSTIKYNKETPSIGSDKFLGNALVASGAGTYAKAKAGSAYDDPKKAYEGNWLRNYTASDGEKAQINLSNQITATKSAKTAQSKALNEELGSVLKNDPHADTTSIFNNYNTPQKDRLKKMKAAVKKLANANKSPLQSKFDSLSKADKESFYNSLGYDDQQLIKR